MPKLTYPAWFNGPKGETEIFDKPEDVPAGWTSGAEKITVKKSEHKSSEPEQKVPATTGDEIDADGHPWSAEIHAASKSKTKAGLWRMKVGATRPAPLPGFPKGDPAPLDL